MTLNNNFKWLKNDIDSTLVIKIISNKFNDDNYGVYYVYDVLESEELPYEQELINKVCELFKNRLNTDSEVFDKFVDNYWNLKWSGKKGSGNRSVAYQFLKTILDVDGNDFYKKQFPDMNESFDKELVKIID